MKRKIEDRVNAAFEEHRATTALLENFIQSREYPNEIVILACARLDALANLAMTKKQGQRNRFVSFLHTYSGRRNELEQVALPNLYLHIFMQFATLGATI